MGLREGHLGTDHGAHHLLPGWGRHPDSYVEAPDVLGPAHSQGSRAKALIGTGRQGDVWYDPDLPEGHLPNGHMTITGESGSGKTQAMKTILADLSAAGVPALVLDFKDDYAEKKYAAAERFKVYDPARSPLPFNPLEAPLDPETGLRNKVFHTYQLVEILARIYHLGELQEQTLRSAMKQAYDDAGDGTPTFDNVRAKLDTKTEKGRSENAELLSHLAPIFDFGFFSEANPVGFNHIATGNTVIRLAQLPGNEVKNSVAEFFLMALYNHLVALPQTHLLRQVLVLDEAWRVVNSPFLEPLMREARAFGLGIFVATQFPTDLPLAVQGSAATQVYLSQSNPDQVEEIARAVVGDTRSSEAMRLETTVRSLLPLQAIVHNRQYEPWTQCDARPYYARATLKAARIAREIEATYRKLAGEPSGWRECNECGGEGCLACKQSGLGPSSGGPTEPCYMCEGKGYKYGDTPCEHCKATGVINYKYDVGDHAILRLHDPREAMPVRIVSRDFGTPGGRPIGPSYEVENASLSAGGWSPHYRCHEYHLTPKTKRNEHWFAGPPKTAQEVMPPDDGDHICPRCQVGTINADGTCSSCKGLVNDFVKADDQSLSDRVDAVTGPWKAGSKTDAFEPCSACDGSGVRGRVEGIGWPPCRGCGKSSGFHVYPFARETLECNSCAHLDQVKDIAADYNALPEIRCPACKGSGLGKTAELQKFPPGEDDDSPFAPFSTSEWQMVKGPKKRTQTAAKPKKGYHFEAEPEDAEPDTYVDFEDSMPNDFSESQVCGNPEYHLGCGGTGKNNEADTVDPGPYTPKVSKEIEKARKSWANVAKEAWEPERYKKYKEAGHPISIQLDREGKHVDSYYSWDDESGTGQDVVMRPYKGPCTRCNGKGYVDGSDTDRWHNDMLDHIAGKYGIEVKDLKAGPPNPTEWTACHGCKGTGNIEGEPRCRACKGSGLVPPNNTDSQGVDYLAVAKRLNAKGYHTYDSDTRFEVYKPEDIDPDEIARDKEDFG